MSIQVSLEHVTEYHYDRSVKLGPQVVRLRPAPHARTPIVSYSLQVEPEEHFVNWQQDLQSNFQARIVFPKPTRNLKVAIHLVADMTTINPFDFFVEEQAEHFPFSYPKTESEDLAPFLTPEPCSKTVKSFVDTIPRKRQRTIDFLVELNQMVQSRIRYVIRMEPGVQTPTETLEKGSGSCRDSAWLLVQAFRHVGLAARFVSGYLIQLKPDEKSLDGPSGASEDFTDLHAWTEVYLPGAGWVGLDPTSGLLAGEGHIPLAATPKPESAAPISGLVDECEVAFSHHMSVNRIHEDPRVTKPYTERQWQSILKTGDAVDQRMRKQGMQLTMGGEPTFVSIDDMDGAQWNTEALGPEKFALARSLLSRLKKRWSSGALRYEGMGKWYPGEQLPRWVLGCYWRKDGIPVWQNEELFADSTIRGGSGVNETAKLVAKIAETIGVDGNHIIPGYEDAFYYAWKEGRLPVNTDPLESQLDDKLERARLRKVFSRGLNQVVGYSLPLQKKEGVFVSGNNM
ncbi:MAG: transglutaminase family protein, partial [Okeania sp. SIO1H5]|uniref:transglutaminase family protein n=1 Tax=Okeania sp. SIO1H5 TaxID=2607777 RepID=UPI0013B67E7B